MTAARGRSVVEFGTRRAHGTEAGLLAARAAFIGGCSGTSNVEAGHLFGIPTFGTLAHSFVMSFDDEDEAFRAFLRVFPETATVLIDTYDTIAAVTRLARDFGPPIPAVRLDSGDLRELSKQVRQILDEAGMTDTKIFASGDLNEYNIADLISHGAKIDSFGVGTELATSYDEPALSGVYKLAGLEKDGRISMRIKLSHDKETYPGPKQVWRFKEKSGKYAHDLITLADEEPSPNSEGPVDSFCSLLEPVMIGGLVTASFSSAYDGVPTESTTNNKTARRACLSRARDRAMKEIELLPDDLLGLDSRAGYSVKFGARLVSEKEKLERHIVSSLSGPATSEEQ